MKRILTLAAILVAAALSSLSWVSQARAQTLTYVSSTGSDGADCASPATACRSFAGALNKVADGGSVICAGVGEFSSPTITKSVTIDCLAGGGGTQSVRFIINAPGKIVRLRNIAFSGAGVDSSAAIEVIAATNVFIENVFVTGHISNAPGIYDHRAGPAMLVIKNSSITNNSGPGIVIVPASGTVGADLQNVTSAYNSFGLAVGNGGRVTIMNSFFTNNNAAGVEGDSGSFIEVNSSKMSLNQTGVMSFGSMTLSASQIVSSTTAITGATQSYGNNQLVGNASNGTAPSSVSSQ